MRYLFLLGILGIAFHAGAQPARSAPHTRIVIEDPNAETISTLQQAGIDLHCGGHVYRQDNHQFLALECSQSELEAISTKGVPYDILIEDVTSYYTIRAEAELAQARTDLEHLKAAGARGNGNPDCNDSDIPVPQHFHLGDYGGFLYYQEILETLDSMTAAYPSLISVKRPLSTTRTTHQGRPVYWVRLSDNPDIDEDEPEVIYTAVTHAREPGGAMSMLYFMWHLLEQYTVDPQIRALVDRTELYFVPVLNPDGYVYNELEDPGGGGMWRKNLRDNDLDGTITSYDGVDINRNYGFLWGLDDTGSSPNPVSSTYRGTEPFSEPETQMLRDFVLEHEFVVSMHNHSYGNDLYHSWDHGPAPLPDEDILYRMSDLMSWNNRYLFGESHSTYWLGGINGAANDWFYGEQEIKQKIYSWIPEIGHEFWPGPSAITEICARQLGPHLGAAEFAGAFALIHEMSVPSLHHGPNILEFRIENLGLQPGTRRLSIVPEGDTILNHAVQGDGRMQFTQPMQYHDVVVELNIDPAHDERTPVTFEVILEDEDGIITAQRIIRYLEGSSEHLGPEDWTSTTWGEATDPSLPGISCLTDSPQGMQRDMLAVISTTTPLDLSEVSWAKVSFLAKWSITSTTDFAQLQARANDGPWIPLCGEYTKAGAEGTQLDEPSPWADQPEGEPVYDGRQTGWVREVVDLSQFAGVEDVQLRFVAWSGLYASTENDDGFYFADFRVHKSRPLHCSDLMLNADETGIDCGGADCEPCPACDDGILNGDEEAVDCGGPDCESCPSCADGILNGAEEDVDCGGPECQPCATCIDGFQNGSETGIDCGGPDCEPCAPTCTDGIMNGDEEGIDCGGGCPDPCRVFCCDKQTRPGQATFLSVILAPNPASEAITVRIKGSMLSGDLFPAGYEIYDMNGIAYFGGMLSEEDNEIATGILPARLYTMRIRTADGRVILRRFLKTSAK